MAKDPSDGLTYYLVIDKIHIDHLADVRSWSELKVGFDEKRIWVKGFSVSKIKSVAVKSIPYKSVYYEKNGKLYPQNSVLPERNSPASMLWTPMARAIPIKLTAINLNYFGIDESIPLQIVPSEAESEAVAMITSISTLEAYLNHAPAIRMKQISWVILNNDKVFLLGIPLLPIKGSVYWGNGDFILPTGYDFDLQLLIKACNKILNPHGDSLVVWDTDSTYALIDKADLTELSLSSLRITLTDFAQL